MPADASDPDEAVDETASTAPNMKGRSAQIGFFVLIFLPWLMFTVVAVLFALAYHHFFMAVWAVILLWTMLTFAFVVLDVRQRMEGYWFLWLALLCTMALANSCLLGLYNYWTNIFPYWGYEESGHYTNVLPTEPADAHGDAGKIVFSDTAWVDMTRAVGYKSGHTYCVAPIMDEMQTDHVEYWAVGMDCCEARSDFNCDDAWDPKAKSGMVVMDTAYTGSPVFFNRAAKALSKGAEYLERRGISLWRRERDYYVKAAKEALASFQMTTSDYPLFVRWVSDPQVVQEQYWRHGVGFLVASVTVYLLFSLIAGAFATAMSKRSLAGRGPCPEPQKHVLE